MTPCSLLGVHPHAPGPGGTGVIVEVVVCGGTGSRYAGAVLLAAVPAAAGRWDAFSNQCLQ